MSESFEPNLATAVGPSDSDADEFAAVYQEHSRAVYYLALRMLGDSTQAEDATHDVFLKAFRSLDKFRGDSGLRTWLYRIAINHCRNLLQTWHHRHVVNNVEDSLWSDSSSTADNPLRVLENKELGERIRKSFDVLTEEYRLLLLLIADEKLSYEEVAALTEQSTDAVRGKLHRARKAFIIQFQKTA